MQEMTDWLAEARQLGSQYQGMDAYEITKELAEKAGYHRETVEYQDGTKHVVTEYTCPFDAQLSAAWFSCFGGLFLKRANVHSGFLGEQCVDVSVDCFLRFMKYLDLERVECKKQVLVYAMRCLDGCYKQAYRNIPSEYKFDAYKKTGKRTFEFKKVLAQQYCSLDAMEDDDFYDASMRTSVTNSSIIDDLRVKLRGNRFGYRLLKAMLDSPGRIDFSKIDKFVFIRETERKDPMTKVLLADAYNVIKETLFRDYLEKTGHIKQRAPHGVFYTNEGRRYEEN